jgi:hypothetical protein
VFFDCASSALTKRKLSSERHHCGEGGTGLSHLFKKLDKLAFAHATTQLTRLSHANKDGLNLL